MLNKNNIERPNIYGEEYRDNSESKFSSGKSDDDLYHEEDNKVLPVIRVKHYNLPNNDEKWKIFSDSKVLIVIEGKKLTKKERAFLYTIDGINFLIGQAKVGVKAFQTIKKEMKKHR
jgi:hypothetical protein